jgi:hypothetical protein
MAEEKIFRHSVEVCSFLDPDARKTVVMSELITAVLPHCQGNVALSLVYK